MDFNQVNSEDFYKKSNIKLEKKIIQIQNILIY